MLSHYLIKTITDVEEVIKDWKAGILNEEDFKGQIRVLADRIGVEEEMEMRAKDEMAEEGSAEYPLGGSIEPYDIAREKELNK